jgi:hypothetical protein
VELLVTTHVPLLPPFKKLMAVVVSAVAPKAADYARSLRKYLRTCTKKSWNFAGDAWDLLVDRSTELASS